MALTKVTNSMISGAAANITDYGAVANNINSASANSIAIQRAINENPFVYIPVGRFYFGTTLDIPNSRYIFGAERSGSILNYTGSDIALQSDQGVVNSSGLADITLFNFKVECDTLCNAVLSIKAGGWSYYTIDHCFFFGLAKYGIVIDGAEVSTFTRNIIATGDNYIATDTANIWIVNGNEWTAGQSSGFTNGIEISNNQLDGAHFAIIDDGGTSHFIKDNNYNGHATALRFAGTQNFLVEGGTIESPGKPDAKRGQANCIFTNSGIKGTSKGYCQGGIVRGLVFNGSISTTTGFGNVIFVDDGATNQFHTGITCTGNMIGDVDGRVGTALPAFYVRNIMYSQIYGNRETANGKTHFAGTGLLANNYENYLQAPANCVDVNLYNVNGNQLINIFSQNINSQDLMAFGAPGKATGVLGYTASSSAPQAFRIRMANNVPMEFILGGSLRYTFDVLGNLVAQTAGKGLTLVSPNGLVTKTITIDNAGAIVLI